MRLCPAPLVATLCARIRSDSYFSVTAESCTSGFSLELTRLPGAVSPDGPTQEAMPQPENSIKPANAMSPRLLTTTGLLCSQSSISPLPPSRFLEYLQPFSASESVCPLRYHKAVDHPSKRSVPQTIKCFVPLGSRSFKPLMPCCVPDLFSLCLTD